MKNDTKNDTSMNYVTIGLVRYNLKKKRDKSGQPVKENLQIWLTVNYKGERLRAYTGKRINLKNWDEKKQRAKGNSDIITTLNVYLNNLSSYIESNLNVATATKKRISLQYISDLIEEQNIKAGKGFFIDYDQFIERSTPVRSLGTIKKYKNVKNHLESFEEKTGFKISYESIDQKFEEKFINYLIKEDLTNNTILKIIMTLKTFLNYATANGLNTNMTFQKFKIKPYKQEISVLSWEELMKIWEKEGLTPKLKKVRDIFCFGCFTGLRFSDIMNLKPDNISDNYITLQTLKNKKATTIPITKYSRKIIEDYKNSDNEKLFPVISNQKMNDYLKELGKLVKLNEMVTVVKHIGSKRIEESYLKSEIIGTHMARRTFITCALRFGMSSEVIMDITGHSDHRIFERYYKIVDEHKQNEMLKAFE